MTFIIKNIEQFYKLMPTKPSDECLIFSFCSEVSSAKVTRKTQSCRVLNLKVPVMFIRKNCLKQFLQEKSLSCEYFIEIHYSNQLLR